MSKGTIEKDGNLVEYFADINTGDLINLLDEEGWSDSVCEILEGLEELFGEEYILNDIEELADGRIRLIICTC